MIFLHCFSVFYIFFIYVEKNSFVVSKNLARYVNLKIILSDHQNNYVERLSVADNVAKSFNSFPGNQLECST